MNKEEKKEQIKKLLINTDRPGIKILIDILEEKGYFENKASLKYHGNYEGGLMDHSFNMFNELKVFMPEENINTLAIIAFLHDVCKVGLYTENGYNKEHPKGHATLSLTMIKDLIKLTDFEEKAIKYHMGLYSTFEFNTNPWQNGEYSLKELTNEWNKEPKLKLVHWSDDKASQFVDITK